MNIFATSKCPVKSAHMLDDKRVNKMVLESAQMMSTVMWKYGEGGPYKPTHRNHPCVLWTGASGDNYHWLLEHFKALCKEYTRRYGKIHKCYQHVERFAEPLHYLSPLGLDDFVNCTTHKDLTDVTKAYRLYIRDKWQRDKRIPRWYGRNLRKEIV